MATEAGRGKNSSTRWRKVWPLALLGLALTVNIIWIAALGYSIFRLFLIALG